MVWFKVDDGLHSHRKVLSIPRRDRSAAMGLWVLAGSWSAANLTDGEIPAYVIPQLGAHPRIAQVLVDAGLWHFVDGSFTFHAWSEDGRQPSRRETEARRKAWREKRAAQRARSERSMSEGDTRETPPERPPTTAGEGLPERLGTPSRPGPVPLPSRPGSGLGSQSALGRSELATIVDGLDLARIANTLGTDLPWAGRVAEQILERAEIGTVRNPQRYVEAAILERPDDYRPTPTPPRLDELCDHGRDRATCPFEQDQS